MQIKMLVFLFLFSTTKNCFGQEGSFKDSTIVIFDSARMDSAYIVPQLNIDSLLKRKYKQGDDNDKVKLLITQSILANNYDLGLASAKSAIELAEKVNMPLELAEARRLEDYYKQLNTVPQFTNENHPSPNIIILGVAGIVIFFLALLMMYLYTKDRIREARHKGALAKEKAEMEKKDAEFQRSIAEISLSALRSQMNPHFIFNCLNSIKLYTSQNDIPLALEYLTKFSKLIRLVMENSRSERITLSAEIEALQLYIQMEAMRFKEKLAYNITVEGNIETDYIDIPPLLIQPYVENAIWHGLMHKEEGGKIDIEISLINNASILQISILDNGVGRAKSFELKSKTAIKNKSFGMKVTSERIALINDIYKAGANVEIQDLLTNEKIPLGTKVIIQIPL